MFLLSDTVTRRVAEDDRKSPTRGTDRLGQDWE